MFKKIIMGIKLIVIIWIGMILDASLPKFSFSVLNQYVLFVIILITLSYLLFHKHTPKSPKFKSVDLQKRIHAKK